MSLLKDIRLQGALIALLIGGLGLSLLWPLGVRILELKTQNDELRPLIERHYASLNRTLPTNPNENHRVFITPASIVTETDNLSADIQAVLIETLKTNQTRLIDLRENTGNTSVPGLEALSFTLSFEGDLQAIFEALSELAETPWPLLVEEFDLKANGPVERPDRRVRASLTITLWMEVTA